jgi:hypothetical protein
MSFASFKDVIQVYNEDLSKEDLADDTVHFMYDNL